MDPSAGSEKLERVEFGFHGFGVHRVRRPDSLKVNAVRLVCQGLGHRGSVLRCGAFKC